MSADQATEFTSFGLAPAVLQAVQKVGYETPSPIQAQSIPILLDGEDLLGQAQTGTGKTAAFALPLLSRIDVKKRQPQLLVLAPTRELAIQVAEAFQTYARFLPDFHVLPIYGGQAYDQQLKHLKRGVQVVVGTPGRVMDHIRRGTLKLDGLQSLVLDEADEMLRMGFIDDIEWILEHTPESRQTALFSATMPSQIKRVAQRHLRDPKEVSIKEKTATAKTIRQRYWQVSGLHKLDALTRILEVEAFDAVLVFVRTKTSTVDLAEKLSARGYACEALNGDIPQNQRERTVDRLKKGKLDILIATDVVARGLDVERISHVVNFDIPYDVESYVHRIGRTGRAGRTGDALLFVAPRERRMLKTIERVTRQPIEPMDMPSAVDINQHRISRFKEQIIDTIENRNIDIFHRMVGELSEDQELDPLTIAAALASLAQKGKPFLLNENEPAPRKPKASVRVVDGDEKGDRRDKREPRRKAKPASSRPSSLKDHPEVVMERFKVDVGYEHGVKPGNLVGAIANEAEIDSQYIGQIEIHDDFSTVDLPEGMPKETFDALRRTWVCQQKLNIRRFAGNENEETTEKPARKRPSGPKGPKKKRERKPKS
ncbi:DEAD/DEAH box helicase [Aestuariirhabdus sp. Z084]|uniref:DEAD/DEAH box helicase n=1 Tax=Aestuariirhabdus haliotis TaxID=2918751 RepID=UPI00201B456B|nr:DEAD/DEAH box helicase [Aestuariirhabdus haliotis]MCL6414186.1 DEAD/DEAH box helicase [Aestuariirhabdus haliotis]MCL6418118.1 DEAD/DEAH box helicase [Aestuariirhabdus haliotis]